MASTGEHPLEATEVHSPLPNLSSNPATNGSEDDPKFNKNAPVIDLELETHPQEALQPSTSQALSPTPFVSGGLRAKRRAVDGLISTPKTRRLNMSSPVKMMPVGPESFHTPDRPTKALKSPPEGCPSQLSSGCSSGLINDFDDLSLKSSDKAKGLPSLPQEPSTPVATSVQAHRSTPPTLAADDFVGGRVLVEHTPDHARFRRMLAMTLDEYSSGSEESA